MSYEVSPGDVYEQPPDAAGGSFAPTPEVDLYAEPGAEEQADPGADENDIIISASPDSGDERAAGQQASAGAPEETEAEEPATGPGDAPPPTTPPTEQTGDPEEQPNRGEALQELANFAGNSHERVHDRLRSHLSQSEDRIRLIEEVMREGDVGFDRAVDLIGTLGSGAMGSDGLARDIAEEEGLLGRAQYGAELTATGLALDPYQDGVGLRLTDAEAFAAALREASIPEDAEAAGHLTHGIEQVTSNALRTASGSIVTQNVYAAADMCGGELPTQSGVYYRPGQSKAFQPSIEDSRDFARDALAVAAALPEQAESMAESLETLDAYPRTVDSMRQLAAAQREGLVLEWAVAHDMLLVGDDTGILGVDRFETRSQWESAFNFMDHMETTAPDSELLARIRAQVVEDIGHAMGDPGAFIDDGDDIQLPPEQRQQRLEYRQELIERAQPLLREAWERINNR